MMEKWKREALKAVFFLFLFLSAAQPVFAKESGALTNLIQVVYNDQNGLPASEANTVLQTRDGYIWIGGYGGLIRYDGREFINYSTQNSGLTSSGIRALFEDSRGRLWVGTNDRGVFLYENGIFTPCVMPEGDLFRSVRCFAENAGGTVFVGTSTGLAQIEEENRLTSVVADKLEGQTVYSLSFDKNNVLWGTTGNGVAFAFRDGAIVYWFRPGALNAYENYVVLADGEYIYIGTSGNILIRLSLTDDSYTHESFQTDTFYIGSLNTVNTLYINDEGELWIGCNTGSGWFDRKMSFRVLEDMEQNTFLSCITQDYEGNLWMASTQGGVFQLIEGRFFNANKAARFEGKSVNCILRQDGLIYAATDFGLCIANSDWNPVNNELTKILSGFRIRHLFQDSAKDIWISTYGNLGLIRYTPDSGEILSITEKDGLLSNKVREVIELENGDIAAATTSGVCIVRNGVVAECYGQEQGLENPVVLCLLQTSGGALLAGSDGMGIYAIKDGKIDNYSSEQGLDTGVVLRMREDDKADGVWISAGSGLYFMDSQGKIREIEDLRYGVGSVFDIQVMEEDIWLTKSSGVIIVPRKALLGLEEMTAVQYGRESGLTCNLTANSWNLFEDGILYLSTVNGVFLLDSGRLAPNTIPPRIAIDDITVQQEGGKTDVYKNPSSVTLPSDTLRVTIRFACLSFAGAPGTIAYQLENFDEKPVVIPANQDNTVSYTNLRGGDYVFHLSAENADGVRGENDLIFQLHKEPKVTERPAVWICLAALALLTGVLISRLVLELKTRQLWLRQQEYKKITDQALKTIANTIDAKDPYTKGHSVRVAGYSRELARRMGLPEEEQEQIYYIALLHDIGKIGIPDAILNKPGKLSEEEFSIMQRHTTIGSDILRDFTSLPHIGDGALSHHENIDGSGYPDHRLRADIPLVAQIIRVADSYDAMATKRAYRDGMSKEYILSEFEKFGGVQFDQKIARLMTEMITEGFTLEETEPDL